MLSVFTYYSDFSMPIEHQHENIIISDCKIDYADRFLHYNYSGNEMWQQNRPLKSIRFENIAATDISMPLTAYGDKKTPITLEMDNVSISFRKGFERIDFMHVCNYDLIMLKNLELKNYKGNALLKKWSDGNIIIDVGYGAGGLDILDIINNIDKETNLKIYLVVNTSKFETSTVDNII